MSLPGALFVIRWMVRDTFRQSLASRTFWLLLALSAVCILLCASVRIEGPRSLHPADEIELQSPEGKPLTGTPRAGHVTLGFGAVRFWMFRDAEAEVHFLLVVLARYVAGALGTLLILVFTAGFMPEFLQPSAAAVLLAKPTPRWAIVVGKYLGVLVFVAFQATVFVGGTWVALGARTGIWLPAYLLCIPILVMHFAIIYSFSAFLAVYTRSTVACVLGSVLFWLVCCGMNYGRHAALMLPLLAPETPPLPAAFLDMLEVGYWVLPKPIDLVMVLDQAMQAGEHVGLPAELQKAAESSRFLPDLSLLSSLGSTVVILLLAARQLVVTDY
jgi:ABC-type transport system involved in multi-copper enzyme maturation permease subunit